MPDAMIFVWIATASAAISGLLNIWNFFQSPAAKLAKDLAELKVDTAKDIADLKKENAEAIDQLDDRLVLLERGMGTIEATLQSMPTKNDLHKLEIGQEKMNTTIQVVSTTLEGVKETNDLMRDWLLKKGVQ